jgi:hypothetical protein
MTLFRYDDDLLTGMHAASSVVLSCAGAIGTDVAVWTTEDRHDFSRPRCFPSFRQPSALSVGVRPGRKQGPEENSHEYLINAVVPARNVV